jgi:two-component system phosphate regulon response regulator OmpR
MTFPATHTATSAGTARPADDAAHILVVDDDSRIRQLLSRYLGDRGFRVTTAGTAGEARLRLAGLAFDVLIVDVMMPGEDGVSLVRSLRQTTNVPILMLTALAESESRVQGLEAGADDYVAKPFDPRELVLRINNILKRSTPSARPLVEQVTFGPFVFNRATQELKRAGETVHLTERERQMLTTFTAAPGDTVPREALSATQGPGAERTVDVQINRLRRKIEADPANPLYLQTVRGIGYRLATAGRDGE